MLSDLSSAVGRLRRAPGYAAAVVLMLAFGIGATTAMFSVVDAVLLRPLPLPDPARVVTLDLQVGAETQGGSPALLAAWGEQSRAVAQVAAVRDHELTVLAPNGAERVPGFAVSGTLFSVLGVMPALGRAIRPDDDRPGAPPVAVIGDRLWRRAYAADPAVVGRTVPLDGVAHTVVGVLPPAFDEVAGPRDVVVPLALDPSQRENFTPYLTLVGRLAPGVTPAAAARDLDAVTARLGAHAAADGVLRRARVVPLDRSLTDAVRRPLWLLLGALAALLLACANAATLVLVRGAGRARELAVRAALGAGRGRLAGQLAAEQLVLGAFATAGAVAVAAAGVRAFVAAAPAGVPRLASASLDARAVAVAALLGLGCTALCGVVPALAQRRLDLRAALQAGARGTTDRGGERWRRALVGAEVALAVVLLTGAALLLRSAAALGRVRPGFDTEHVLTARFALPVRDYPELGGAVRGYEAVLAAARGVPGVASAALVSRVPLGGSFTSIDLAPAGRPAGAEAVNAALRITSPDYFHSMGVPLLAGRDLRAADGASAPPVVVVNVALARRLGAPSPRAAVGLRVRSDNGAFRDPAGRPRELEVVGVVGDVRDGGRRGEVAPEFYAPMGQVSAEPWDYWVGREMVLVARTAADPAAAAPALRRAVAAVDARVPLYDVQTTGARLDGALAVERFTTRMLAVLGALGLGLAALGVHGVVAYAASRRRREVGVRLALGSTPGRAAAAVVGRCLPPVAAGAAVGGAAALWSGRAASALLFGVTPQDPTSVLAAVGLLAAAAAAAAWGPARRAARTDPATAMRPE